MLENARFSFSRKGRNKNKIKIGFHYNTKNTIDKFVLLMETILQDIATVSFGIYLPSFPQGQIPYLQVGDFDENGYLRTDSLHTFVEDTRIDEKFFLRAGDILLAGKGTRNQAIFYQSHYPPAVASSIFFIIRVDHPSVMPEYLAVYLNHPRAQTALKARIGSAVTVPTINKKELLHLPVPMPPLSVQQKLIRLYQSWREEKRLIQQLAAKKEQLVHKAIAQHLSGKLIEHTR